MVFCGIKIEKSNILFYKYFIIKVNIILHNMVYFKKML
jgi:hypothetical protein